MSSWTMFFLIIALISGTLSFTGIITTVAILWVLRIMFSVFLVLLLISLVMHLLR